MKKIYVSLITICIISFLSISVAHAYFSDAQTSPNNTFSTGTLNLRIDSQSGSEVTAKYNFSGWLPGQNKIFDPVVLKNVGTIPGKYWIEIKNVRNSGGELGSKIGGYFYENTDPVSNLTPSFNSLNLAENVKIEGKILNPNQEIPIVLTTNWLSSENDNLAQGSNVIFDVVFHLDQVID